MSPRRTLPRPLSLCLCLWLATAVARGAAQSGSCRDKKNCKVVFSQQELRKRLTPLQYHVTQEKGTESAFEGEYTHHKDPGIYKCVVCGTPLFKSESKFDSGSDWAASSQNMNPTQGYRLLGILTGDVHFGILDSSAIRLQCPISAKFHFKSRSKSCTYLLLKIEYYSLSS
ncbi:methionine-R-sulfoxide reductase B3 isoform X3 [Mustela lutreola]|uniref:methionine-R-sulfoxide reductase B3 isoform X3 n=1 Tax=Mustela lutreola TaxID=9666 RepID=UPI002797913B|nr:methionine-R-sulfoxide reductase B3 isoform X3 [Mustela lutreola]